MANVEEAQDLKRLRQTPPPTVETAVASPLPVPTKAHVNRNANTFDKQEEWKSNLRCVSAGAGCLGAAGVPSLWRRHVTRRRARARGAGVVSITEGLPCLGSCYRAVPVHLGEDMCCTAQHSAARGGRLAAAAQGATRCPPAARLPPPPPPLCRCRGDEGLVSGPAGERPDWWWTGPKPVAGTPGVQPDGTLTSLPMPNLASCTRQQALDYFDNTWCLTEVLFSALQGGWACVHCSFLWLQWSCRCATATAASTAVCAAACRQTADWLGTNLCCPPACQPPPCHQLSLPVSPPCPPHLPAAGEESFYRPPAHNLRHPFIFYYGHVAVFYVNKLRLAGVQAGPLNLQFEQEFEVGVDEVGVGGVLHCAATVVWGAGAEGAPLPAALRRTPTPHASPPPSPIPPSPCPRC